MKGMNMIIKNIINILFAEGVKPTDAGREFQTGMVWGKC